MTSKIKLVACSAFLSIAIAPSLYAKPLPPTVAAGTAVARNYPKGDPATSMGVYCQEEKLTGELCVFGASAKAWDVAFTRAGYSVKDTLGAISHRGQMGMLEYDAIGMSEILMPYLGLTGTPGGMDFLVEKGMLNRDDVPNFMALTGKTAGKLTGASHSAKVASSSEENIYNFTCGKKALKIYATSGAAFIGKNKTDDLQSRQTTTGYLIDFREYAEMGGTYTQYQLAKINDKKTLTSQWLNADGDPLRASDVVSCTQNADTKGKMPNTKSVMEMIRSGELE